MVTEERREGWVISIKEKLEQVHTQDDMTRWEKHCIYRVPHYLHRNDKKSYIPRTVSIGPYHHGEEPLRFMEYHKWRAVTKVLERTQQGIEMYLNAMTELEDQARSCYQGSVALSSNEFTEMLVLDGCFVLEIFRGTYDGFSSMGYASNDPVFVMRGLMHSIQTDMVMLENQLPLFVLDRLLELQLGRENQTGIVAHLAVLFLGPLMPTGETLTKANQFFARDKALGPLADMAELHCLDVFRRYLLRPSVTPNPKFIRKRWSGKTLVERQGHLLSCVTELREAGVEFRLRTTDRFWDIEFKNGFLEIPELLIHEGTKCIFSNLIAFEQCHIDSSNDITSYIVLMDHLIDSSEDVAYLRNCGIIDHWLGSDSEVVDLFHHLCHEVIFDRHNSYLYQLSREVDRYCSGTWIVLMASLRYKYINHPWAYYSSLVGLLC